MFKGLPDLPNSRQEALQIAALYPTSMVLTGDSATRDTVLRHLSSYRLLHFAVHAVMNQEAPEWSLLLLSPGREGQDGRLFAWQVADLDLHNTEVVFLSACSSGAGIRTRVEGVESFAHAFLSAGVPAVIGTLWPISDNISSVIISDFYSSLRKGEGPVEALRSAQVKAIQRGAIPKTWAAFQVIGA